MTAGTTECFSGLAAKSRELSCLSGLLRTGPAASGAASSALALPAPDAAAAKAAPVGNRRNKTPSRSNVQAASGVTGCQYLAGGWYISAGVEVVDRAKSREKLYLRAYSFDSPALIDAIERACARGALCSVLADAQQCSRTKLQWQALKRAAQAGARVRLCSGSSVRDAYVADGRGPAVGAGLKGLHHAKALLRSGGSCAELVVGSLNWSTSSKANLECGVLLTLAQDAEVVGDYTSATSTPASLLALPWRTPSRPVRRLVPPAPPERTSSNSHSSSSLSLQLPEVLAAGSRAARAEPVGALAAAESTVRRLLFKSLERGLRQCHCAALAVHVRPTARHEFAKVAGVLLTPFVRHPRQFSARCPCWVPAFSELSVPAGTRAAVLIDGPSGSLDTFVSRQPALVFGTAVPSLAEVGARTLFGRGHTARGPFSGAAA
ncbi:unnamed protein product [Symbiodinium sp. CCMP2592]|nr:unnamed protein product [Symbiodinium sp. CCMP2592]